MNAEYFYRKILWRIGVTLLVSPVFFKAQGGGGILILICSLPLAFVWAGPIAEGIGTFVGNSLWMPSDASIELRPQYSIAEARVREGHYEEAIEAFRGYAAQYPDEIIPHVRIADLQLQQFGNVEEAIAEFKTALPKARGADAISFLNHRLADLYLQHRNDPTAALDCFREIQRRFPKTRQSKTALERAEKLLKEKNKTSMDAEM